MNCRQNFVRFHLKLLCFCLDSFGLVLAGNILLWPVQIWALKLICINLLTCSLNFLLLELYLQLSQEFSFRFIAFTAISIHLLWLCSQMCAQSLIVQSSLWLISTTAIIFMEKRPGCNLICLLVGSKSNLTMKSKTNIVVVLLALKFNANKPISKKLIWLKKLLPVSKSIWPIPWEIITIELWVRKLW